MAAPSRAKDQDTRAMFENVIMLAGLGGAVVPLVIHLLSRARYRTVEWGAMMFLDGAPRARRPYVGRLREAALLAVRMAAVALLAVALARPIAGDLAGAGGGGTMSAAASPAAERGRVAVAIVVDCSASMGHDDVGGSRIAQARAAVLQVLSGLRRGDRACLIPAAPRAAQAPPPAFTGDLQSVAARAGELRARAGGADLAAALTAAAEALDLQEVPQRRLYVITDHQAATWRDAGSAAFAGAFREQIAQLRAEFAVIPVGPAGVAGDNVAVTAIDLVNPPAVAGGAVDVEVTVRNDGPSARLGVPLALRLAGREVYAATLNLEPREQRAVTCTVTLGRRLAAQVLTAEVRADNDLDDICTAVVDVVSPIRVLIVRGRPPRTGEADYLAAALAPFDAHRGVGDAIEPGSDGGGRGGAANGADLAALTIVTADEWDEDALAGNQVLVLDDVPALSESQARAVERFVYGGGGLLLAPGPAARTADYNRLMFREDAGLLPALLQPLSPAAQPPLRVEPATVEWSHPVLRFLAPRGASDAGATIDAGGTTRAIDGRAGASAAGGGGGMGAGGGGGADGTAGFSIPGGVLRCFPVTGRTVASHVLAGLSSGDPLLIESPFGRGRVLLITCSLGAEMSSLPLSNVYLPLVQSAARHLASASLPRRNVMPGQELLASFDALPDVARAAVQRPDGTREVIELDEVDGRLEARYADTRVPGLYTIRPQRPPAAPGVAGAAASAGALPAAVFSVAPPAEESDLTPLSPQRWQEISGALGFRNVYSPATLAETGAGAGERASGEYWLALLAAVLGLFVIELAMARAWTAEEPA